MSLQMRVSRAGYQGDPGLGSFFGKVLKGISKVAGLVPIIGDTISSATGIAGKLLDPSRASIPVSRAAIAGGVTAYPLAIPSSTAMRINATSMPGTGRPTMMQAGGYEPGPITQVSRNMGLTVMNRPPSGYHPNKSGYWVNGSAMIPGAHYVAPGTTMVKNRRTNPLNPHALSRSLRRLQGFAKATKHMRTEAGRIASSVAGPKRATCGCGKKKR